MNATNTTDGTDDMPPRPARRGPRGVRAAALVAGGLVAGGVLAGAVGASAATSDTATAASSAAAYGAAGQAPAGGGQGRSDETVVTGTKADTLRAAALKAVPGGTVDRIETDAGDAAYEVHMTKSDGTKVTVKFGDDLAVVKVEDGMGQGDPAPSGSTPSPNA
jgi:uncharacterized membrane protein YkoI